MSTLFLAKLYNGKTGNALALRSTDIYDVATRKYLSAHISETNVALAQLQAAIAGKAPSFVKDDITARDAMTVAANNVLSGSFCWVKDASADSTVNSGAALYLAEVSGSTITWSKVTEVESLDVVLSWASIQNKPSSTVSQIDQAVTDSHTHSNSTVLAGISADSTSGNLTYNGVELNGETGIAFVSSLSDTATFNGQIKMVVEEFDPDAESGSGAGE